MDTLEDQEFNSVISAIRQKLQNAIDTLEQKPPPPLPPKPVNYAKHTRVELLAICKEKGLRSYHRKSKNELILILLNSK